jgi:hypothetical protein
MTREEAPWLVLVPRVPIISSTFVAERATP